MKDPLRRLLLVAFSVAFAASGLAADKVSQGDGLWSSIGWSPTGTPVAADLIHIEGGNSVNYNTGTSPNFNRVYVGDNTGGGGVDGTLEVSGGTFTVNANAAGAYIIGRSAGSTGTINVTGGTLRTTGATGGGMQLGFASGATGNLNISSGAISLTAAAILGSADGATGHMTVSGGTVTTSTGTNNAIFYVGGRLAGSTAGTFEQTGGSVNINNNSAYFAVGYAGASQNITGTARLLGGTFNGNVRVGRQSGTTGTGSGTLIIGPNANVTGRNLAWEIGATGNLQFALGTDATFHGVDLTTVTASNALIFSEAGAKVTVDGTNLAASSSYTPVNLINFASGKGPDAASKSNVVFDYTGFAAGFAPALLWKDTGLLLYFYGLPAYGFWLGGSGTWTNTTSPFNWGTSDGSETGDWSSRVATFGGTAGTVTVDNSAGAVVFTGATFNTTGYLITGDSLTTNTAATPLLTGDAITATLASPIAGSGGVAKTGLGTVILSGANTYTGATTVTAGTLRIEGDQSAATGAVTVAADAVLAGAGRTGGVVTVQNDGTLKGQAGQTFTMNGLVLGGSANLDVTLGAPSTTRLFQVNGDLTLDGILNVTADTGFGPGVYRLIDYTGGLTDNGLSFGVAPVAVTDLTVQTSVANQVNLVFNATTRNFWSGGNGVWTADASGAAWDNFNGSAHGAWQPQFAIFQAAPGTVTVDTTAGAVVFTGAQFATDGYTVAGGNLTTSTANTILRVGDGSVPGAGVIATISSAITGSGGVEKTDLGTLVLSGTNNYSGGTTVSGGTLQLGAGGTTGSILGNVANNAAFAVNRSDAFVFGGVISGSGALAQRGSGSLVLTADNTYTGGTTISAGTLQIGNGGVSGSLVGDVTDNAALVVNRSNAFVLGGAISGTGTFRQNGAGTTTLTGANTYLGGTTISSGVLRLGAGGTTGSIAGNVVNNASLVIDRSNAYSFGGAISGSGAFRQAGAGTTTLTGANTYAGATDVAAGALLINGNQSAATGAITVAAGATLGGSGQTGGVVTVQDGGTLRGQSGQTFTSAGLVLNAASILDVSLGAPGTTGLFQVNGNLVLDGTLAISNGGGFGQGLYRLINYTGSLTDHGLVFGPLPGGVPASSFTLQTSVEHQVNLLYNDTTTPLPVWEGGSGTWSAGGTNTSWGTTNGSQSGGWRPGMAIFDGAAGTVTVDDSVGPIVVSGIQFASTGYVVTGGTLTNQTPKAIFRVGDGTAASAAMTATISAAIAGSEGINKTDLGTLILAGNNTFLKGVTITAGVLQVGSDANLGEQSGPLAFAGGTLRTTGSFTATRPVTLTGSGNTVDTLANNVVFSGNLSGTGSLTKRGAGQLTLGGNNTNTGTTVIAEGGIFLNGSSLAATTISAGARLSGNGTIRGALTNNGLLSPGASPGTITTTGNFTQAATGTYFVELAPAAFDRLVVVGTATLAGALQVTAIDGYQPRPGQTFKIVEANRVTGQFSSVTVGSPLPAMLRLDAVYGSADLTLAVSQRPFASLPGTGAQLAIGRAIDAALARGSLSGLRDTLNNYPTEPAVLSAVSQLSPGSYGRWFEQAVFTSDATMRAAGSRLAGVEKKSRGLWMELVRRDTRFEAARENQRAEGTTDGIVVGGDLPVGDALRVGALFSYTSETLKLDQQGGRTETDRFSGALYGRYVRPGVLLEAVAGAGVGELDSRRNVLVPDYLRTARSSTDSAESFFSFRAARPAKLAAFEFEPYLAVRYVDWSANAFTETGADDANLKVREQEGESLGGLAGLAVSTSFHFKRLTLSPRFDFAVQQELMDKLAGKVTAEIGGSPFTVAGHRPKDLGFVSSLGVDVEWQSRFSAYVRLAGEWQTAADEGLETRAGFEFRF